MADVSINPAADQLPYPDFTGAAVEGAQAGQALRGISALQGIDLNDPESLNRGIGGLVRAGAADQAKALIGLQITRNLYSAMPGFLSQAVNGGGSNGSAADMLGAPGPSAAPAAAPSGPSASAMPPTGGAGGAGAPPATAQPGATPNPAMAAMHAEIAKDALDYSKADPEEKPILAGVLKQKYAAKGVPSEAIDQALAQSATPEGASQFAAMHTAHAQLQTQGHGDGVDPTALVPATMQPPPQGDAQKSYEWAKNYLAHPEWSAYESMLKSQTGVDLGLTARAQAIMGPEFSQEADVRNAAARAAEAARGGLPYGAPQTVTFNGRPLQMTPDQVQEVLRNPTLRQLGFGAGLTPEEQATETAAGTAKGAAPAGIVSVKLQGGREQQGTFEPGPNGTYTFRPLQAQDGGGTHPLGPTSSPGEVQANVKSNEQLVEDRQDVAKSGQRVAVLKHVETLLESPQGTTGPGTQVVNGWRNFLLAHAPTLAGMTNGSVDAAKIQSATQDELKKYMTQMAGAAASSYGVGTDYKLAAAASGNPNPDISNLANRDVTRMNLALERAQQAKMAAFDQSGQSGDTYQQFSERWGRTVDPRAFMLDLLSKKERGILAQHITSDADRRAFLAGKEAAIKAGIYSDADIPR